MINENKMLKNKNFQQNEVYKIAIFVFFQK